MLPFKLVYSERYHLHIGEHVFPGQKYRLVQQLLLASGVAEADDFVTPEPARDEDLLLAHTPEWVRKLREGTLSVKEELLLEIPYSREVAHAFWMMAGGSILAAELALRDGVCLNLGGGFHHAFPDHGEGFCMVNDVAIAVLRMQQDKNVSRVMILDCDVHQGNGTAVIFGGDSRPTPPPASWAAEILQAPHSTPVDQPQKRNVFTISLHQENNYPAWKPPSSIDINLRDGVTDAEYLNWLDHAMTNAFQQFQPDLLAYVAGADPYQEDQLGGLALSIDGLKQRDEFVFGVARQRGIPIFATFAGGYARRLEDTVRIHTNTVLAARDIFSSQQRSN